MLLIHVFTILFIVILECTHSTKKKIKLLSTVCQVMLASHISRLLHLLIGAFSFVLDLILCCFVHHGPWSSRPYNTQPRCVVSYTLQVCATVLYEVCMMNPLKTHFSKHIPTVKQYVTAYHIQYKNTMYQITDIFIIYLH